MSLVDGTVAITDYDWYKFLLAQQNLDEVNFWTPSAHFAFRGDVGSPFFFKLKARYEHAVCGFAMSEAVTGGAGASEKRVRERTFRQPTTPL